MIETISIILAFACFIPGFMVGVYSPDMKAVKGGEMLIQSGIFFMLTALYANMASI
jgi:hypothetical protein